MKILIPLLLCLIFATPSYAGIVIGSGAAGGDDCSGDLMWSGHFEGTGNVGQTFDVTTGTPAGCVDTAADRIITYYSDMVNSTDQKTDGSYSIYRAGASDYAAASFTGFNTSAMSISFNVYVTTFINATNIIRIADAGLDDYILVNMVDVSGNKFQVAHCGTGTVRIKTDTNTFLTDTWYTVNVQFKTADSPYLRIKISTNSANTGTTALSAMTDTPITLHLGHNSANAAVFYIDNIKIYTNWQTGAEWGD